MNTLISFKIALDKVSLKDLWEPQMLDSPAGWWVLVEVVFKKLLHLLLETVIFIKHQFKFNIIDEDGLCRLWKQSDETPVTFFWVMRDWRLRENVSLGTSQLRGDADPSKYESLKGSLSC